MSKTHLVSKDGGDNCDKRSLPSWIGYRKEGNKSTGKKQDSDSGKEEACNGKKGGDHVKDHKHPQKHVCETNRFSKLMEGVVFVLSGFVNPERGTLRSQALEMGAEYKIDWTSDCTLLICAFPNTPKFRQVEADCGTIVKKEWISQCYNQKKLVEIDQYLMHAGRSWRKKNYQPGASQNKADIPQKEINKQIDKRPHTKIARSENSVSSSEFFSHSKVKEWAVSDLKNTISWLESQGEKPEAEEIKKIAAEGIITCLQDSIEALKQNQDIGSAMEQWMFVPHVVKELEDLNNGRKASLTKQEIIELASKCKQIYSSELEEIDDSSMNKKFKQSAEGENDELKKEFAKDDPGSDSDATIEMTEEEINLACQGIGID